MVRRVGALVLSGAWLRPWLLAGEGAPDLLVLVWVRRVYEPKHILEFLLPCAVHGCFNAALSEPLEHGLGVGSGFRV